MSRRNKSNHHFQIVSPVNNEVYLERQYATTELIEQTLSKSLAAQKSWRQTSLSQRAQHCREAVKYLVGKSQEIGAELTWQMGRPIRYSPLEITGGLQERALHMIDIATKALGTKTSDPKKDFERYIKREPLGTVFVIAPWNYPFLTSVNVIIPALMSGNTVLLKQASQTALVAERYREAFQEAGLPEGVFQYLHLDHQQAAQIMGDHRINYLAFTGSVAGGYAVQKALSNRFISAGLELGGKDPALVRSDTSLKRAVDHLVDGSYFNSGQSCCGIERIYVHQPVFRDFVDAFVQEVKKYILGNPMDTSTTLGPMVKVSAKRNVETQIARAIQQGAHPLIPASSFPTFSEDGAYLTPQVLVEVNHKMDIMREETFGPVVGIMPVKDDTEAISLMNDSPYGLTASIWTSDADAAKAIGDQLQTGTVFMNRCDYLDPDLAWTGVKQSGRGCTLSTMGYESLTRPKSYHLRAWT